MGAQQQSNGQIKVLVPPSLSLRHRYKMPRVIGKVEGRGNGIKTVIFNVMDLSLALKRDPGEVCKFFGTELGAQARRAETFGYMHARSHKARRLEGGGVLRTLCSLGLPSLG